MNRRRACLAIAALAAAPRAFAQGERKRVVVTWLEGGLLAHWQRRMPKAFAEEGFVEGRNLELAWLELPDIPRGQGDVAHWQQRVKSILADAFRTRTDCVITRGDGITLLASQVTKTIPIVTDTDDPVGFGIAASLRRPGGNITGLHGDSETVWLKRFELLRRLWPGADCMAWWLGGPRERERTYRVAARAAGVRERVLRFENADGRDVARVGAELARLKRDGCHALHTEAPFDALPGLALEHRILLSAPATEHDGVLFYNGFQRPGDQGSARRLPAIAARILRGEKPGDIPFEGPTRFETWLNLRTAAKLGISVPSDLLVMADHVQR